MGLRLKFNLILSVVFPTAFAAAGYLSRQLLLDNARELPSPAHAQPRYSVRHPR